MVLKISLLCKKILIAVAAILGIACVVACATHFIKGNENNSSVTASKEQKVTKKQEAHTRFAAPAVSEVPELLEEKLEIKKHNHSKGYKGENKYWGVQPYANIPLIEGNKGASTIPEIKEEGEGTAKNVLLGFKPSDNIEVIFDKYRSAIEEKGTFNERDLLPFQVVDLNDSKTNTVYYGMPRELQQEVMEKNGLEKFYNYTVTYKDEKQVEWNFYKKEFNDDLDKRSTIVSVSFTSDDILSREDKNQLHKIPLDKKLPADFVNILSNLETDNKDTLKNLGLEVK